MSYTVIPGGVIDNNRFKKKGEDPTAPGIVMFLIWFLMLIPAWNHFSERHPPRIKMDYIANGLFTAMWPVIWTFDVIGEWGREPVVHDN